MSKEEVLNILKGGRHRIGSRSCRPGTLGARTLGARSLSYSRRRISRVYRSHPISKRSRLLEGTRDDADRVCYGGQGQERGLSWTSSHGKARGDTGFLHPKWRRSDTVLSPADRLELSPGLFRRAVSGQTEPSFDTMAVTGEFQRVSLARLRKAPGSPSVGPGREPGAILAPRG